MAIPPRPWPTGVTEQLDPPVARVLAPNASPFTYTGTQSYLVGTTDLAVIDPGPDDPAHIAALMGAIAGRPVAHRAYLMAVSMPSAPEFVKNTISRSFGIRFFSSSASKPERSGASIFTRLG